MARIFIYTDIPIIFIYSMTSNDINKPDAKMSTIVVCVAYVLKPQRKQQDVAYLCKKNERFKRPTRTHTQFEGNGDIAPFF